MSISEHIKNVLPLIENPVTVQDLAQSGCLPPYLHIESIAVLMYPDSEANQEAYKRVLRSMIISGNIEALTTEEYTESALRDNSEINPDKYRDPITKPKRGMLLPHTRVAAVAIQAPRGRISAVATNETDIIPGDEKKDFDKKRLQIVHRDELKKWLIKEKDWPVDKAILLSNWWDDEETDVKDAVSESGHESDEIFFRVSKEKTVVRFAGNTSYLNTSVGLRYMSIMLQSPGKEFHAQELKNLVKIIDLPEIVGDGGATSRNEWSSMREQTNSGGIDNDFVSDEKSLMDYKHRITELKQLIEDLDEKRDYLKIAKYEDERDQLNKEEKNIASQKGIRQFDDDAERARKAVFSAVSRALKKIEVENITLFNHLNNSITLGVYSKYHPEEKMNWIE